jgi:hypothetical protein
MESVTKQVQAYGTNALNVSILDLEAVAPDFCHREALCFELLVLSETMH